MAERITITINTQSVEVDTATTVAAAILNTGVSTFKKSVTGTPRGPLCGMGICFECCVEIDQQQRRSCRTLCQAGMEIRT